MKPLRFPPRGGARQGEVPASEHFRASLENACAGGGVIGPNTSAIMTPPSRITAPPPHMNGEDFTPPGSTPMKRTQRIGTARVIIGKPRLP